MSASTIARWNAIPLSRAEEPTTLKRKSEDDDEDDDVSVVSRTPSPDPEAMDVDQDVSKYDEYVRKPAREVITVETRIKPTNKGFAMLEKLGWTEGQPLGLSSEGRIDPIPFQMKVDSTGLGKARQDVEMIETTVSQRVHLDSERQQKETEEQRQVRENAVARKSALATEISDTLKAFYCSLCDKQFKNVAQYDEHTNSYAHHHKARFKDMQANARIKPQEDIDKRKEKERKREEKELRKIAAASGVKMTKQTLPTTAPQVLAPAVASVGESSSGSKASGWATVSGAISTVSSQSGGSKKAGWATVGSASESATAVRTPDTTSGWHKASFAAAPSAFQTGGWATLDAGPGTSSATPPPAPPVGKPERGGWATVSPANSSGALSSLPSVTIAGPPTPSSPTSTAPTASSASNGIPSHPPSHSHTSRVGWQQFQKSNSKRKL